MTNAAKKIKDQSFREPEVNAALAAQFGLNAEEYARVLNIMGRTPSYME